MLRPLSSPRDCAATVGGPSPRPRRTLSPAAKPHATSPQRMSWPGVALNEAQTTLKRGFNASAKPQQSGCKGRRQVHGSQRPACQQPGMPNDRLKGQSRRCGPAREPTRAQPAGPGVPPSVRAFVRGTRSLRPGTSAVNRESFCAGMACATSLDHAGRRGVQPKRCAPSVLERTPLAPACLASQAGPRFRPLPYSSSRCGPWASSRVSCRCVLGQEPGSIL